MHNLSGVSLRIAAVLGLGAVAAVVGCHDFGEPHAGRVTPIDSATIRRVHARLLAQVMAAESDTGRCSTLNNNCTVTVTETPANYQAPDQTSPITATFSKPIYRLIVMGSGAFQCSGAYGRVTVYNRTYNLYGGWQVEQRDVLRRGYAPVFRRHIEGCDRPAAAVGVPSSDERHHPSCDRSCLDQLLL